jgi:hypothetical protein
MRLETLTVGDNDSVIASVLAVLASAACLATPVHGNIVKAGRIGAYISPGYDVVDGRLSLHVGPKRVKRGLNQKILWFVSRRFRVGPELVLTGHRLSPRPATFMQRFPEAFSSSSPNLHVFPSIVAPPKTGCWRFTLRTAPLSDTLTVLVRPAEGSPRGLRARVRVPSQPDGN